MYKTLRPLLFLLDEENSHKITFGALHAAYRIPGFSRLVRAQYADRTPPLPITLMGLKLANPVGLAAGLDKNARFVQPLADLGFGYLEVGTLTPRPQPGNPKKRLFRLVGHSALINRMGFNNEGVAACVAHLRAQARPVPVGINIGKNADTPIEHAVEDYLIGLRAVYPYADYVAVNISSPNTARLRELQAADALGELLDALAAERERLRAQSGRRVPIALKIAPDLDETQVAAVAHLLLEHRFDAVIATNTTLGRAGVEHHARGGEKGGLSGSPLRDLSTRIIGALYAELRGRIPIIGVGGINSAEDAWEKLVAGADAVQLYTALIYEGPRVVGTIVRGLAERVRAAGAADLTEAVALARRHSSANSSFDAKPSQKKPTLGL